MAQRFGLKEDSARNCLLALEKKGVLLPKHTDPTFSVRNIGPWIKSNLTTDVPIVGTIRAGAPENSSQEISACLPIPLEQLGITNGKNIFALEVRGASMNGKNIVSGDFVILDKSKIPRHGNIVAALVDNQTTLKTYCEQDGKKFLRAENPAYRDILPAEELVIQGVAVYVLRKTL